MAKGTPRRKAIPRERILQRDCLTMFIQGRGYEQALIFAVPNGEERHPLVALALSGITSEQREALPDEEYLKPFGQGVVPGINDLVMLTAGGETTLIEMKVPPDPLRKLKGGTQSRGQKLVMAKARQLGHDYRICDSQQAFWDICAEKGVKLRVARPWAAAQPSAVVRRSRPATAARPAPG